MFPGFFYSRRTELSGREWAIMIINGDAAKMISFSSHNRGGDTLPKPKQEEQNNGKV